MTKYIQTVANLYNSAKAIDYAVELARRLGAKLTLLHVVPEPSALDYSIEGIARQEIEGWEAEAEKNWHRN